MNQPKLGSGGRFAALKNKLSHNPKIHNPGAVAASIGREKYGKKKFQSLAAHGHHHHHESVIDKLIPAPPEE